MNQLWKKGFVFALLLLVATAPPLAVGQTPTPPAAANTPLVEVPAGQEATFPVEGARNGGRLLSFTSSNPHPLTVEIIDTASFTGLNLKCETGREGLSAVTYTWRDAQGREQTGTLVVACGVKIDRKVTVTAAVGETVKIEFPFVPEEYSGLAVVGTLDVWFPQHGTNGTEIRPSVVGTTIIRFDLPAPDGTRWRMLVTIIATPRRVSQVIIPENGIRQAVSSLTCPAGSPLSTERSGIAPTFAGYYGRSFGDQFSPGNVPGMQNVHFITCQPNLIGDSRVDRNAPPSYSAGAASVGPSVEVLQFVVGMFSRRVQASTQAQNQSGPGTQALGVSGRVPLSDGSQVPSSVVVASYGNVVYWVSAQGMGVPPNIAGSPVFQLAQRLQGGLEGQAPRVRSNQENASAPVRAQVPSQHK